MEIRILRGEDVKTLLPMDVCVDLMKTTMIAVSEGRARLPLRSVLPVSNGGLLGNMPGYLSEPECFGVKLVSIFPKNVAAGYSSHLGLVLLFEPQHGLPVALLDAAELTAIRTAAVSGLATRLLARSDAGDLTIMGSGEQARSHLQAMLAVRQLRRVRVWSHNFQSAKAFAQSEGALHRLEIEPIADPREAVGGADIICTVSKARNPILMGEWISPGAHLNVVGSSIAAAAEVDLETVKRSRFFVDYRDSTFNEAGEYLRAVDAGAVTPDHILGEVGEVANGSKAGRVSDDDVTLYKSLGIAAEDLAAAHYILEQARARGIGQTIDF